MQMVLGILVSCDFSGPEHVRVPALKRWGLFNWAIVTGSGPQALPLTARGPGINLAGWIEPSFF